LLHQPTNEQRYHPNRDRKKATRVPIRSINIFPSFFFFQAEDGIRDGHVTGVQTCALPISVVVLKNCQRSHFSGVLVSFSMNIDEYAKYDALGLAELVSGRQVAPKELAETAARAIEAINPAINAVVETYPDRIDSLDEKTLGDG